MDAPTAIIVAALISAAASIGAAIITSRANRKDDPWTSSAAQESKNSSKTLWPLVLGWVPTILFGALGLYSLTRAVGLLFGWILQPDEFVTSWLALSALAFFLAWLFRFLFRDYILQELSN
jgi:hypothetical protein